MDLMTLAAKIQLDDSEFNSGVGKAEKAGKQLAGKMSAMTVAIGNLAAQMIQKGFQAMTGVVTGAMDGFADYQQLIGGVETLFKDSADKVASYARQSYKTTGLSANEYMETVTSFSASLLQGLGGDTEKAAKVANLAITDMADNANKMGTDISSIQTAYQGFAKQNYTMLDNLKLGYGGTREEMIRLINDSGILSEKIDSLDGISFDQIIQAIHKIQTEMGITGTTAKEAAETISGSKMSLKAAWEDMLSAMGGAGGQENFDRTMENFKTSFSTYLENFIPTLVTTISNSGGLVGAVADAIASIPDTMLRDVGKVAIDAGTDMVRGVGKIANWLIDSIINVFRDISIDPSSLVDLGAAVGDFLGSAIKKLAENPLTIAQGIFDLGVAVASGFAEGLFSGLFGEDAEVDKITDELYGTLEDAEYKATKSGAILSYMKSLVDQYGEAAKETAAWKEAVEEMKQVLPESGSLFENFTGDIDFLIADLDNLISKMRETAIQAGMMKALKDSYELLGEQSVELHKQQRRKKRNEIMLDESYKKLQSMVSEEAQRQLDEIKEGKRRVPFGNGLEQLQNLAQGKWNIGGEEGITFDLSELTSPDAWNNIFKTLGKDSAPEFSGTLEAYNEARSEIASANEKIKSVTSEIEATNATISDLEGATKDAASNLGVSFDATAAKVDAGGSTIHGSLEGVAAKLAAWNPPQMVGNDMPEATGIDYVPYNGFRAELHRGEMILPRSAADAYRNGGGSAAVVGAIQNLNNNLQNMQLVVGRKTFGRAVVGYGGPRMNDYIGRAESRRASGYGT